MEERTDAKSGEGRKLAVRREGHARKLMRQGLLSGDDVFVFKSFRGGRASFSLVKNGVRYVVVTGKESDEIAHTMHFDREETLDYICSLFCK